MAIRKMIIIDEEKCDGCGECVPACAEGALQIIDGKAKLVSETYCDGLGACLGECPQGALTVEDRDVEGFNPEAVKKHLAQLQAAEGKPESITDRKAKLPEIGHPHLQQIHQGCPGSQAQSLNCPEPDAAMKRYSVAAEKTSQLRNWPVQLNLAPIQAPYFDNAELLIAADCVPFALPDFHSTMLAGKTLLIGCPKLDNVELYIKKLAEIFAQNNLKSIELAIMEVPCCFGLVQLVRIALENSGKDIQLSIIKIGIRGQVLETIAA